MNMKGKKVRPSLAMVHVDNKTEIRLMKEL
jgi:hypothetical protein